MSLNYLLLAVAAGTGLASAGIGISLSPTGRIRSAAVAAAGGTTIILTLLAGLVGARTGRLDFFGVIHLVYLNATAGIPIVALGMLIWSRHRGTLPTRTASVLLAAGLIAAPLGLYATHVEPFWLRVDRVSLESLQATEQLRIGVLSDLQTPEIGAYEQGAIARLLDEQPDIVVIPGDLWQTSSGRLDATAAQEFRRLLAELTAGVEHVIAVEGNTDDVAGLRQLAQATDVIVLHNEIIELRVGEQQLRVAGLGEDDSAPAWRATIDALADAPAGMFQLVVAHLPDAVLAMDGSERIDLVVAGHTHGGQVAIPFFGPPLTLSAVGRSVGAGGLHAVHGTPIYVSTGVGRERNQAPQVRFLVRPSIGIIDVG